MNFKHFVTEFSQAIQYEFNPSEIIRNEVELFINELNDIKPISKSKRTNNIFYFINKKFKFNSTPIKEFLGKAAKNKVVFNYHQKNKVNDAFDFSDVKILEEVFKHHHSTKSNKDLCKHLKENFKPILTSDTLKLFHKELINPTITRRDSKPKDWSEEILTSIFSSYIYTSFPKESVDEINDPIKTTHKYYPEYWDHLHNNHPDLFTRDGALYVAHIKQDDIDVDNYISFSESILSFIKKSYQEIINHGYFALIVDPLSIEGNPSQWSLYSDIVLFSEKHISEHKSRYYFKSKEISDRTKRYIKALELSEDDFSVINRGFYYLDTFIIGSDEDQKLVIIFQKNEEDETLIPCPTCRSSNVQGNSYSSLGVRSWECKNQLCPDRSKFNRGKRYSFLQILKQDAINDDRNLIPVKSVRYWSRDICLNASVNETLEMLIRHYTLIGDSVKAFGFKDEIDSLEGRFISNKKSFKHHINNEDKNQLTYEDFFQSTYFKKYLVEKTCHKNEFKKTQVNNQTAILGDSFNVLCSFEDNCFDGAVTSPPYYNAREYSQWDNIYTYLYDMFNINKQVYRVLKKGGVYLFNIFDYFDNENNIALSAMGDKRMILGAYIIDMFERVGFKCIGNIVWDKGEIEGKRGFNNGNFSPYYQAPFNCWEHVLVFRKDGDDVPIKNNIINYIKEKPVIKMVKGKNTHGHTAPFPVSIPNLLFNILGERSTVLDPFGGSMTTGIASMQNGGSSVCIEKDEKYFNLGVSKLQFELESNLLNAV